MKKINYSKFSRVLFSLLTLAGVFSLHNNALGYTIQGVEDTLNCNEPGIVFHIQLAAGDLNPTENGIVWTVTDPNSEEGETITQDSLRLQSNMAGDYLITAKITNELGDTTVADSFYLPVHEPLSVEVTATNINCKGPEGTLEARTSGGKLPITAYSWNNGLTSGSYSQKTTNAGEYIVTVTDANGCTATDTAILGEDPALVATVDFTHPTCGEGGSATLHFAGKSNYEITLWRSTFSSHQTSPTNVLFTSGVGPVFDSALFIGDADTAVTVENLQQGEYFFVVKSGSELTCSQNVEFTLEDQYGLAVNMDITHTTCGQLNGTAAAVVTGGAAPFHYSWENTASADSLIEGLATGFHEVTITDANGCEATTKRFIYNQGLSDTGAAIIVSDINCQGYPDSAHAVAEGAVGNVSYLWSTGPTTQVIAPNIESPTSLRVTITDTLGCTSIDSIDLLPLHDPLSVEVTVSNIHCDGPEGVLRAFPSGGNASIVNYSWNNGLTTNSFYQETTTAGVYIVTVTDANGCTATDTGVVGEDPPLVTSLDFTDPACGEGGTAMLQFSGKSNYQITLWKHTIVGQSDPTNNSVTLSTSKEPVSDGPLYEGNADTSVNVNNLEEGDYYFSIRSGSELTCWQTVDFTLEDGLAAPSLSGSVSINTNETIDNGTVTLFQLNATGAGEAVGSATIDQNGAYSFAQVEADVDYILLALPNDDDFPNAIASYYNSENSAFRWDAAEVIQLSCGESFEAHISLVSIDAPQGAAEVKGRIAEEVDGKQLAEEPLADIEVILVDENGNPIATTTTDENGNFIFTNVAQGSYQIVVDIPGLEMQSTYDVIVDESGSDVEDLDFTVTATGINKAVTTALVENGDFATTLGAFPNPYVGETMLQYSIASPSLVQLRVLNLLGEVVYTTVAQKHHAGTYQVPFGGSALDKEGIFIAQLRVDDKVYTKKIVGSGR